MWARNWLQGVGLADARLEAFEFGRPVYLCDRSRDGIEVLGVSLHDSIVLA